MGWRPLSLSPLLLASAAGLAGRRQVCTGLFVASCAPPASAAALASSIASPRFASGAAATFERIEGSGTDGRLYALLRLPDGARCILACAAPSLGFDADRGPLLTAQRLELAVTMGCGSMRDPKEWEGLAHLAEHVTLGSEAGTELAEYVDQFDGSLNGFTSEELTTFHAELPAIEGGEAEAAAVVEALAMRFAALFDCWRATPLSAHREVVERELRRVDEELVATRTQPSRQLLELGQYKARANPESRWARLGRGSAATLPVSRLDDIRSAVDSFRTSGYAPLGATLALCSPLPLPLAASIISDIFKRRSATFRPVLRALKRGPPPFGSGHETQPMAVARPGRYACLTVGWCIPTDDRVVVARAKPFAILGEAFTAPHAASAVEVLRAASIAPLAVEMEPALTSRVVAAADGWSLWQVTLVMLPGSEKRWREARDVLISALGILSRGVPMSVAAEAKAVAEVGWKYSSRAPSAVELSRDLQDEPSPPLAIATGRSFIGSAAAVADAATEAARRALAYSQPIVTLYAPNERLAPLTTQLGPLVLPVPSELANSLPLMLAPLEPLRPSPAEAAGARRRYGSASDMCEAIRPPPPNPWAPASWPVSSGGQRMATVGRRFGPTVEPTPSSTSIYTAASGSSPSMPPIASFLSSANAPGGLSVAQLPGCIGERGEISIFDGKRDNALSAVSCFRPDTPFGVALLQLDSNRPADVTSLDPSGTSSTAACAELWRLSVLQSIAQQASLAARMGVRLELSFHSAGLRFCAIGAADRAGALLLLLVRAASAANGTAIVPPEGSALFESVRRSAASTARAAANSRAGPLVAQRREDAVLEASAAGVANEAKAFWKSATGARLILAGAFSRADADTTVNGARAALAPYFPRIGNGDEVKGTDATEGSRARSERPMPAETGAGNAVAASGLTAPIDRSAVLRQWTPLLYKPSFFPKPLANNLCLTPALAATLDQCGGGI